MSKLLQVRLDDTLKAAADSIFASMGLDTSTAVRMFLTAAIETRSLPFEVKSRNPIDPPFICDGKSGKLPFSRGCMKGKMWIANDFNAPLEDFMEYME
jgi:addiction module RelB/DinJ family antitoxin